MGAADKLYAGNFSDFADSMAGEMEKAFGELLAEKGKAPLDSRGEDDRRMLFIAIARGVIRHLQSKQTSFVIRVPGGGQAATVTPVIGTRGLP
ncbi:MAG: hypothetical protein IT159_02305 [Bryobacterales bacterium]|nr:hypothetical protein [Bryobacterales bacterium]